jgi:hypothetical protein
MSRKEAAVKEVWARLLMVILFWIVAQLGKLEALLMRWATGSQTKKKEVRKRKKRSDAGVKKEVVNPNSNRKVLRALERVA